MYKYILSPDRAYNHRGNRVESTLELSVMKRNQMPAWFSGHEWSGDTPGARIRQARIASNMTIRDLAKTIGMATENLGKVEADHFAASPPNLRKLALALNLPVSYLGCFEKLPEKTLGQRIRKARLYQGLTKREFAESLGVCEKTLRGWEQDRHEPSSDYLKALDQYLVILK